MIQQPGEETTYHNACTTLRAPNNLPTSTPPFLEYMAKVTLCTAGENPLPIALSIPNTVKETGVGARPINKYEMISMSRDA